jgi:hypothetical protein
MRLKLADALTARRDELQQRIGTEQSTPFCAARFRAAEGRVRRLHLSRLVVPASGFPGSSCAATMVSSSG